MPRGYRSLQVSFAGGEIAPELWSRHDDSKFRSGAARLRNMISHAPGAAARRPGFGTVHEAKDSTRTSTLMPFRYSTDQTNVIEMGRSVVDGRDVGYFRFHTDGGTLLQPRPDDYRAPVIASVVDTGNEQWTTGIHTFQTGDPIIFTMEATTETVTFTAATNLVTNVAHGFIANEAVMFRTTGALPAPLQAGRIYYVQTDTVDTFRLLSKRDAQEVIDIGGTGTGTHKVCCLPSPLDVNATYYAIAVDSTHIKIATTRANAVANVAIDFSSFGTVAHDDVRIHYDYRNGSTAIFANQPYYCRKPPWGSPQNPGVVFFNDHQDHAPTIPEYWVRQPGATVTGKSAAVTFTIGTDRVNWADHGVADGEPVTFITSGGLPNELVEHTVYYVLNSTAGDFQLSATPGGPLIDLTGSPSGTHTATAILTFDLGTNRLHWTAHGLSNGDPITITTEDTLPIQITAGTVYYVRNVATDSFQLAASVPGTVFDLTGIPSGVHTAFANGIYEVPHHYAEAILFEINTVQSGDILTLVHLDRPIAELRRLGPTHWVLVDVLFNATVAVPTGVDVATFAGEGHLVTTVTNGATTVLTLADKENFAVGDKVMVEDVADIPDGHYIVSLVNTAAGFDIELKEFDTGEAVVATTTTVGTTSRVRPSGYAADWDETYAVTALDDNNEESAASASVVASNNLLVVGAQNTISWDAVTAAKRYRIYKEVNGLLGFIGEVDAPTTTFLDDNIAPDLSITPPILDDALRTAFFVVFDTTSDLVTSSFGPHGLEAGAPVIFDTDGVLPLFDGAYGYRETFYVLDPTENTFLLAATPDATESVNLTDPQSGFHFAVAGTWPAAVGYFEQRRVFGGARLRPQDFWMTASSTETDLSYSIPTQDSDRIHNRLAARERSQIRHAVPTGHLLLLTSAAEYRITPLNDDALTPGSVSARAPTQIGVSPVAPVVVNNVVLFPAARGGHLRELGFLDQVRDYVTGDVSLRAAHLFDNLTIVQMAYQQAPQPVVWAVSSSGTLLGLTYVPEEQIAGWTEIDINGTIESCAAVAEGTEDRLYVIVKRGATRYVERMGAQVVGAIEDVFYVDSGITYDGTAVSSLFVPHLAGLAVRYLADGVAGTGMVSAAGTLTLASPASTVHVGLAYTHELRTLPLGMQVDAALGSGRTRNINQVWLRVSQSGTFQVGPSLTALVTSPAPAAGQLQTALVQVAVLGSWDDEGQVYVQSDEPLPSIVTGLTLEVASGG